MPYERQILLSTEPVPRRSVILLSVCAHVAALLLVYLFWLATRVQFVPVQFTAVQAIAGSEDITFNEASAKAAQASLSLRSRIQRQRRVESNGDAAKGAALKVLRQHAKQATAGMIDSFRVSAFYGIPSDDYQVALQTSGELPHISATELPPRYQQLVTVEITIDTDGHVADARIVGGEVSRAIQLKLLAAVREFKYSPAKHYGTPIPSQVDLIVHVPTIDAG